MQALKFHHLGLACQDIEEAKAYLSLHMNVQGWSETVFDPLQQAWLCIGKLEEGPELELIAGDVVRNYVKRGMFLYHTCWQVADVEQAVQSLEKQGHRVVSAPKKTVLFAGRQVAFLHSEILGLMELVETDGGEAKGAV